MFNTPTDSRLQFSPSVERMMAFVGKPLPFPAGMDLCRERVAIPGHVDRTLRFVVEGSLWQSSAGGQQALLPGAIVGEDALFSDVAGDLDVRTVEESLVLDLSLPRQKELTAAFPAIAFELLRAAGAAIAARGRAVATN